MQCLLIFLCLFIHLSLESETGNSSHGGRNHIHVFVVEFDTVASYMIVCIWLILAILAKIVFHHFKKVSSIIPESCLLIALGVVIGAIVKYGKLTEEDYFTSNIFFYLLLPPIMLDAGYFINTGAFFENFWTIISFSVNATLFNALAVGLLVKACMAAYTIQLSLIECFLFGAITAAVDPVAVLAVFEELHVNEILYIIVFGESILNDGVTVVLYNLFIQFMNFPYVTAVDIGYGIGKFLVASLFGTGVGLIFGLVGAFVTRFTNHVCVIEPLWIFLIAYSSYLTAECFHFSGILSVFFCGIILKYYTEINVSNRSRIAIKYLIKTFSSSAETYIFIQLGVSMFNIDWNKWDTNFALISLTFIIVVRFVGVFIFAGLANICSQTRRIGIMEQLIMGYGGLRGAVAFSLALILPDSFLLRGYFVSTIIFMVLFTCFIQGISMKPLVKLLRVRLIKEKEDQMFDEVNDTVMQKMVKGVYSILGIIEYDFVKTTIGYIDKKLLRRAILKKKNLKQCHEMILKNREILYREAEGLVDTNPSALLSREVYPSTDMLNLNHSTLMMLKNEQETTNKPAIDYNMLDKIKKNQAKLERPILAIIVNKTNKKPGNRYTVQKLGEEDVGYSDVTPRDRVSRPPIVVIEPNESQADVGDTLVKQSSIKQSRTISSKSDIENILNVPTRFRKSTSDVTDISSLPTLAEVSLTADMEPTDKSNLRSSQEVNK